MATNCDHPIMLKQAGTTTLYEPEVAAPQEWMLFLRWETANPPATLRVEDTWAEEGDPADPGYFVFLNTIPASGDLAAVESELRKLERPKTTGFVWASYAPGPPVTLSIQGVFATKPGSDNKPEVKGDASLKMPPGFMGVGVANKSPVFAQREDGCIRSFTIGYPPIQGAEPPRGPGLTVPLAGDGVGCLQFLGLVPAETAQGASSNTLALVRVSMDPLHPLDTSRNYVAFTGRDYSFDSDCGKLRPISRREGLKSHE